MKVYLIAFSFLFSIQCLFGQVGINTTDPQQSLHIAGSTGSLRIESLNTTNNSYNGGDANGDGDQTNDTYPLYVDENGDFTLELITEEGSEDMDAFNDINLPTTTVFLDKDDLDGIVTTTIKTYTYEVTRPTLLEVKYGMSFDIYLNNSYTDITDNLARRVQTYITVTGQTRKYGPASKVYSSGSVLSVNGNFYNSNSMYITLPAAGTYVVSFMGLVDSGTKTSGSLGTNSKDTYVEFATGNDFVFIRKH